MRIGWHSLTVPFLLLMAACTKDITLSTHNAPKYVIDGRVSSLRGPYYIRVTKTDNLQDSYKKSADGTLDKAIPVLNAEVIITDDAGNADTLIPVRNIEPARYYYFYRGNGIIDSLSQAYVPAFFRGDRGYYETTRTTGRPGHTYQLQVRIGTDTFRASAYMPSVPLLDSVIYKEQLYERENKMVYMPRAYFREPQNEKNYYLLTDHLGINTYPYDDMYANFMPEGLFDGYVVNDRLLQPYVNGLSIRYIVSSHYKFSTIDLYGMPDPRSPRQFRLHSLTKEAYDYYTQLDKQFEDDGNVYKPTPSSPVGNISNGALGLFWATDISYQLYLH